MNKISPVANSQSFTLLADFIDSEKESFRVESGSVRVTDPCYDQKTWCAGSLTNVRKGNWNATAAKFNDPSDKRWFDEFLQRHAKLAQEYAKKLHARLSVCTLPEGVTLPEAADHEALLKVFDTYSSTPQAKIDVRGVDEPVSSTPFGAAWMLQDALRDYERMLEREAPSPRVSALIAWHEDVPATVIEQDIAASFEGWIDSNIHVGVDSGQAGFFDMDAYDNWHCPEGKLSNPSYDAVCDQTLEGKGWGVPKNFNAAWGVVSSSGYGDGGYTCLVRHHPDGTVMAMAILYICRHEGDEEENASE